MWEMELTTLQTAVWQIRHRVWRSVPSVLDSFQDFLPSKEQGIESAFRGQSIQIYCKHQMQSMTKKTMSKPLTSITSVLSQELKQHPLVQIFKSIQK